jgi:hypothetical protein
VKQPNHRLLTALLAGALLASMLAVAPQARSGSLSTAVIGMFPKDVGEFAYADLKSARKYPWFPQLREQLLPKRFREFEKFLASAGADPSTQVEELAWGSIQTSAGEDVVGVALGQFDPSSTEAHFKQQKLSTIDVHGYHLYAFSGGNNGAADILFAFIDSNTAAFGTRPALEKLIDVRTGTTQGLMTDEKLFPLINEANGKGLIWAVLDKNYTHIAMQQLVPQASQFPQAATIIDRLQAMTINIDADSGVDANFQAVCNSPDDANLLAAALQAGLMYRRYQEAQNGSALAGALEQIRIAPSGNRLKVEAPVSQDQLLSLIRTGAFTTSM